MQNTLSILIDRCRLAATAALGADVEFSSGWVQACADAKFGDYQFNGSLALAKAVGRNPREVANGIVAALDVADVCEAPEIAGPGFINLRLKSGFVAEQLRAVPAGGLGDRMGIPAAGRREVIAVDFCSPNLAKEMHVGHIRSTIIGESVCRILEFGGHTVHRINHVGDWGTQFGMLVAHLRETNPRVLDEIRTGQVRPQHLHLADLEKFYVEAKQHFEADPGFADQARQAVVALQSGDPTTRAIWQAFCAESIRYCQAIFDRLSVTVENRGESFYNDRLADVLRMLDEKGMVTESEGALCVFLDGYTTREGEPLPMLIRKSDGGYNYSTTDLAAIHHRRFELGATRLIYVVGSTQSLHLNMLFDAARKAGWGDGAEFIHLAFGSLLGPDGKPFKTREGGTVKLKDLLDEAVVRASQIIEENERDETKRRGLTPEQATAVAETVGISAVKYFDLSHNLGSDYRFDWDTMLAMEGNTAPYMLYAYARIRSIGRMAGIDWADLPPDAPIILDHPAEIGLAKTLLRFPERLDLAARELKPNVLTEYLFELSKAFNFFYDRKRGVRVKDAEPNELRISRLRLCDLTARALRLGLHLLSIETVEQM